MAKVSEDVISKEEKVNFVKALNPDMMSSEEEKKMKTGNDILRGKFLHFETGNFKNIH